MTLDEPGETARARAEWGRRSPAGSPGLVIDLDGTLHQGGEAIAGAAGALLRIRDAGLPVVFATNTTRVPQRVLVDRLRGMGLAVHGGELYTAPRAAARWLRGRNARRLLLLVPEIIGKSFRSPTTSRRPRTTWPDRRHGWPRTGENGVEHGAGR